MQWRYDENRADFRPALPGEMEADPDALYIVQRGDVLMVREDGHERPMPERLEVAGVMFDREQFEGSAHPLPLRAEMERDGQWARAQLQARDRAEIALPLELPIWVTKTPLTIEDMNEIAAAGWAGELESVRLSGDPLESLAGIDEIITRGDREAFTGLLHAIIEQPDGPVADRVRTLYERVQHRAADPEFAAWPQYQAAYWLAVAIGQFRLADVAQRQVPSDDPTIMHAVYVLADYPVLAALAAERTQATRLDGRACRAIYEDARQRIDWQAMPPHEREFAQRLGVGP